MIGRQLPVATDSRRSGWQTTGICLFLAIITFAVFGQTMQDDFVNFDDDLYVYANPTVEQGLTPASIGWAFTHTHSANWHPLTWLSHMLDCQIYGLKPAGHHFTNVLLHTATVIALFLVLRRMTGAQWPSLFVAAVFAIHPLRVESVAWIAERKDVLSGLFFVLTVGAYVRYARRSWSWTSYWLVMLSFAAGLMCKPMLVTVPLVLLLLDFWPLQRKDSPRILIVEKLPLLALSAAACGVTLMAQQEAIHSGGSFALPLRLGNAVVACAIYLRQMVWPARLVVLYPFPEHGRPPWEIILSGALLVAISAIAWVTRRKQPWVLVGWLWYLVMLLPVLGFIQVGRQAHADRYTYLPLIGISIALTWMVTQWRLNRTIAGTAMAGVISVFMIAASSQTQYWKNSGILWSHALDCTVENATAENNLGSYLSQKGRMDEAIPHFQMALKIRPDYADAHHSLGIVALRQGELDEAISQEEAAITANPYYAEAHYNLGNALRQKGHLPAAIAHYQAALQSNPSYAMAENNLGTALRQTGRIDEAIAHFQKAAELMPANESVHFNLARSLFQTGQFAEAISQYKKALHIEPADIEAENNLAWILATCAQPPLRDGEQAVQLAKRANELAAGKNPVILGTLAAAFAQAGQLPQAVETAQHALTVAQAQSNTNLTERLLSELKVYQAGHSL